MGRSTRGCRDVFLFRDAHRFLQLVAGLDADVLAHALLERREYQVCEKQESFAFLEHLDDVEFLPAFVVPDRLEPAFVEFDADAVGMLGSYDGGRFLDAFFRYVGGSDENDLSSLYFNPPDSLFHFCSS